MWFTHRPHPGDRAGPASYDSNIATLEATDGYGYAAYLCASDQGALVPLADEPSVLAAG